MVVREGNNNTWNHAVRHFMASLTNEDFVMRNALLTRGNAIPQGMRNQALGKLCLSRLSSFPRRRVSPSTACGGRSDGGMTQLGPRLREDDLCRGSLGGHGRSDPAPCTLLGTYRCYSVRCARSFSNRINPAVSPVEHRGDLTRSRRRNRGRRGHRFSPLVLGVGLPAQNE